MFLVQTETTTSQDVPSRVTQVTNYLSPKIVLTVLMMEAVMHWVIGPNLNLSVSVSL